MGADHDTPVRPDRNAVDAEDFVDTADFEFELVVDDGEPWRRLDSDAAPTGGLAVADPWLRHVVTARRLTAAATLVGAIALVVTTAVAFVGRSTGSPVTATATARYTYSIGPNPLRMAASGDERWAVELPGRATGSFSVGGEVVTVAVASADDGGDAEVLALDLADGRMRWTTSIDDATTVRLSSPPFGIVVAEYRTADGRNALVALDEATGEVRWERAAGNGEQPTVFTGIEALVISGIGRGTTFLDPLSGDEVGRVDGVPISIDRRGAMTVLSDDRVTTVEFDAQAGTLGPARDIAVDPGDFGNVFYVLGDQVVRFDRDGAATLLATPFPSLPGRGRGAVGLEVTGTDDLVPTGGIAIDDTRLVAIADDRIVGLELVDDRLEVRWERPGIPLAYYASEETWVLRIGDANNRTQVDSPTRMIDARNGRWLARAVPQIVDDALLLDDGLIVQAAPEGGMREVTAYRLDGAVAWTTEVEGSARIGDQVLVVLETTPTATVVTALGPRE